MLKVLFRLLIGLSPLLLLQPEEIGVSLALDRRAPVRPAQAVKARDSRLLQVWPQQPSGVELPMLESIFSQDARNRVVRITPPLDWDGNARKDKM
jgi:hypothetical protein